MQNVLNADFLGDSGQNVLQIRLARCQDVEEIQRKEMPQKQ
jgi:hypothetical protein